MREGQKANDVVAPRSVDSRMEFRWYSLLTLCVLAQVFTVLLTWQLWQVRETPLLGEEGHELGEDSGLP